jgi:hypothetical protein
MDGMFFEFFINKFYGNKKEISEKEGNEEKK